MTLFKYRFSNGDRRLVVDALRAAADRFNTLAEDLEEDRENPSKAAAYVSNRMKSEDCLRLAGEIGRASCRKECPQLCRSRWSPYH